MAVSDDHDTYGELTEVHFHDSCEIVGRTIGDYVIVDSGVGNDPDTSVPDGVPTTPEEAASGGGGGTDPVQVQEDFSHADVPGTYDLDTGSFTTTTTRSTSDEYALRADDSADGVSLVLRDDVEATAGNTYTLDAYFPSGSDNDAGVLFGARSGATSWSDYTGYMAFFDSNDDQIRVDYWENGSPVSLSSTAMSWPTGEWLTAELDYRDSDGSTITLTVADASGNRLGNASLEHTSFDSGAVGWYNYHTASDWHVDSLFEL
ncbi:hypothetical protein BRC81_13360 [Halobacteriales archaeon QS_1_68_20]|nr:MAG: hypothetical protein BRC81_13360 [Halobacteriales archaeon QS_1_68_20]